MSYDDILRLIQETAKTTSETATSQIEGVRKDLTKMIRDSVVALTMTFTDQINQVQQSLETQRMG